MEKTMVERKMLTFFGPLRLLFGWKTLESVHASVGKKEKHVRPKDVEFFPPETNRRILIEHYKILGRGPM